MTSGDLIQTKN